MRLTEMRRIARHGKGFTLYLVRLYSLYAAIKQKRCLSLAIHVGNLAYETGEQRDYPAVSRRSRYSCVIKIYRIRQVVDKIFPSDIKMIAFNLRPRIPGHVISRKLSATL